MNGEIFCVFDSCAKRYLTPFFAGSIDEALRSFRSICNEEGHQFHTYPTDYSLFHIGHWNAEEGSIAGLREPHSLGLAAQFVVPSPQLPLHIEQKED